jgi:hypothetical protein
MILPLGYHDQSLNTDIASLIHKEQLDPGFGK